MTGQHVPGGPVARRSAVRAVSRPHDPQEHEADRAADIVGRGGSVAGWSFSNVPLTASSTVQRQEAPKPKSEDEKYKEAALKAGEAALETKEGKALKEQVLADPLVKTVTDALSTTPGKVVAGAAIVGGVGALAATGKPLPFQAPAIPLDRITPGLSAKVTVEGPLNAPTFVGLTLTYKEQGPKAKAAKTDSIAADTARLRAQQEMFRPKSEKDAAKKAEQEMIDAWVRTQLPGLKSGVTLPLPVPTAPVEEKPVQRAPASESTAAAQPGHVHVDDAFASAGRPLDRSTRRSMEARFGRDFSMVRIHDDARAGKAAAGINSAAFTVGEHIALGAGQRGGRPSPRLLAHELAHVVQQSEGRGAGTNPARRSSGRPMDASLRRFFEPRLAGDLGAVRLHTDAAAADEAAARGARAFTVGSDIVFGKGQYKPETSRGRWILAHELAHVAQARRSTGSTDTSSVERDAADAATDLISSRPVRLGARSDGRSTHRFGEPDRVPDLTFISTSGDPGFLDQAVQYHRLWGLAPRRFNSMQQLLATLARSRSPISRLRIVSHADFDNIFTPLFNGEAAGITEADLRAFGESDVAGLRRRRQGPMVRGQAVRQQVIADARTRNPGAFQAVGLGQAATIPTGPVAQLIDAAIDLGAIQNSPGLPVQQRATLVRALNVELRGLRAQVQQPAPVGAGVNAADVQAFQDAITGVGINLQFGAQPGQVIDEVRTATAGLGQGFRANLDIVRGRLSAASWIDLRGCRVGLHPSYLAATALFFGTDARRPNVSGPKWFQSYPQLSFESIPLRNIAARASDGDVQAALAHWSALTGINARLMWWLRFLASVLRDEAQRTGEATALPLRPPSLAGGLRLQLDPMLQSISETLPPLPRLQTPGLSPARAAAGAGRSQLRNPLVAVAMREIPRYTAADGELRYYLEAGLPLPVQEAANVENIALIFLVGRERQAMNAWLSSEWEPAAPGLRAAMRGDWGRDSIRQVEAVSDLDDQRRVLSMFVSPDPRYAEQIEKT
jgi:hypothetical protein